MTTQAYAVVIGYGPETAVICATHGVLDRYPRTKPAQAAAGEHNRIHHEQEHHQ